MSTGIVSAVLLLHRKGIAEDHLLSTVSEISKYIVQKGHKIGGINENSAILAVRNATGHLSGITTKTKKSIFELQISAGNEYEKVLMLSYYRNTIVHAFLPEAFIGSALVGFGHQMYRMEGVPIARLHEETAFLMTILKGEYILQQPIQDSAAFRLALACMERNGLIKMLKASEVGGTSVRTPSEMIPSKMGVGMEEDLGTRVVLPMVREPFFRLLCSFTRPLIECYWSMLMYLVSLNNSPEPKQCLTSMDKLENYLQWFVESLFEEKVIECHEACSLETIRNALRLYQDMGLMKIIVRKKEVTVEAGTQRDRYAEIDSNLKTFLKGMSGLEGLGV